MRKSLNAVYTMHSINAFGWALLGIFIPIYLLHLGYGVAAVFFYYQVHAATIIVSFFFVARLAGWWGLRSTVWAGFPVLFCFVWALYSLPTIPLPLFAIAVLQGISTTLYWLPLHIFFTAHADKNTLGSSVSKLYGFPQIIGIIAPLVGGILAAQAGFLPLIGLTAVVFLVSAIPLFWIPELDPPIQTSLSGVLRLIVHYPRYVFLEFVDNIRKEMESVVWPVFIFLSFGSILSVGFVGSLVPLGSFICMLLVGRRIDATHTKIYLRVGAVLVSLLWLTRYLTHDQLLFYILTIAVGFAGALILVQFHTRIYQLAKENNPGEFFVFREIPVAFARLFVFSVAIAVATSLQTLFPVAAGASILLLLF